MSALQRINIMIIGIFLDNLTFNHEEDSQSKVWFPDILDILFDSFTQWTNWIGKWPCNWRFNLWNLFIEETLSWAAALYGVELSCRCELIKGAKSRIAAQEMIIRLQLHSFLCITLLKKLDSFLKIGFLFLVLAPGRAKQITGQVLSLIRREPSSPVLKIESFRASKKSFPAARELGL